MVLIPAGSSKNPWHDELAEGLADLGKEGNSFGKWGNIDRRRGKELGGVNDGNGNNLSLAPTASIRDGGEHKVTLLRRETSEAGGQQQTQRANNRRGPLQEWEPAVFVFRSSRGSPWQAIEERFSKALQRTVSLKPICEDRAILFYRSEVERTNFMSKAATIGGFGEGNRDVESVEVRREAARQTEPAKERDAMQTNGGEQGMASEEMAEPYARQDTSTEAAPLLPLLIPARTLETLLPNEKMGLYGPTATSMAKHQTTGEDEALTDGSSDFESTSRRDIDGQYGDDEQEDEVVLKTQGARLNTETRIVHGKGSSRGGTDHSTNGAKSSNGPVPHELKRATTGRGGTHYIIGI
ncbi:hypothetical protein Scep_002810 [Stephania cephalantha]|uniref:Uncharacterized protein n=1 Tax=Stephania cephalantha TaxID=152367 RepID=A0AAP0Q681_9MAGN